MTHEQKDKLIKDLTGDIERAKVMHRFEIQGFKTSEGRLLSVVIFLLIVIAILLWN